MCDGGLRQGRTSRAVGPIEHNACPRRFLKTWPDADLGLAESLQRRIRSGVFTHDRQFAIDSPLDGGIGDAHDHQLPAGYRVAATAILNGLHHEYRFEKKAA
jgi:hypothetical protein